MIDQQQKRQADRKNAAPVKVKARFAKQFATERELGKGERLTVVLQDADGREVAQLRGYVDEVIDKDKADRDGFAWAEHLAVITVKSA
jgi:hypothetical protein